jgi:hypothetical protein
MMIDIDDDLRERLFGGIRGTVSIQRRALRGGLEAELVELVTATLTDAQGVRHIAQFVRKALCGAAAREAQVYVRLVDRYVPQLAPRLLHATRPTQTSTVLFLEAMPRPAWPWRDLAASSAVLERVANLHAVVPESDSVPSWDYEAELTRQASWTLAAARQLARGSTAAALVRGAMPVLERMVDALPRLRQVLCTTAPFACVIHGDLHAGNVVHRRGQPAEPVLVDWTRARHGSALEDVSSWLHSLGAWEPEARRRHDAIFMRYLIARGIRPVLTTPVRDLYWLAGASNALAGALAHHLVIAGQPAVQAAMSSARCAYHWLRVLRRADERLH